ncbi:MAG: hypothetical protein EZS28_046560, partial [Streblomastix strix]
LNVAFSTIVGTLLAPAQIRISNSTLTYGSSTFNPTATNLEVIDVRYANLVVNRGSLSGTTTNGLQIIISEFAFVQIGGQTTTNPTFANLDIIKVDNSQLNVFGGVFTARNPQATLITATNSDVNIGRVAIPQPTLTFSASKVLDVTGGTLNIYRGTLTGINPDTAIVKTLDTPVFIGGGPAAIFNGAKALDITKGSLNITNGTFTGQSNMLLAIITLRDVIAVIGSGFFPTFAGCNILDTYGGSLNLNGGVSRQIETYQTPGTIWTFTDTIVTIGLPLDQYASSTPMFQGFGVLTVTGGEITVLSGTFNGITAGSTIIASDTKFTIDNKQNLPYFTQIILLQLTRGKLDLINFSFSGLTAGFMIQAIEADVNIGDPTALTNYGTLYYQHKPRYTSVYLIACKSVIIQKQTFSLLRNQNEGQAVDIFYTPGVYARASP